jgi:putative transposase
MPIPKATPVEASERTEKILHTILRRRNVPLWLVTRVQIIVRALNGHSNSAIAEALDVDRGAVRLWRNRWQETAEPRREIEVQEQSDQVLESFIIDSLRDKYRSGTPSKFSAEQVVQIVAIACEAPQISGYPISHWTPKDIAVEATKRGIVETISARQVGRFLKRGRFEAAPEPLLAQQQRNGSGSLPTAGGKRV